MTTEFVLIRHGQTDWNVQGRWQGSSDVPLNEVGLAQARRVADVVRTEEWHVIASSPLLRALTTAQIVANAIRYPLGRIIKDARLQERNYGEVEGLTPEERVTCFPDGIWGGMESSEALQNRAVAALEDLVRNHDGKRVMVMTHGRWIIETLMRLTDEQIDLPPGSIRNTSRTTVVHDGNRWHVGDVGVFVPLAEE